MEQEIIFKFLAKLNPEYDQIRCQVLGMNSLPSLREAFAFVQNEESRRGAMLQSVQIERLAMTLAPQKDGKGTTHNQYTPREKRSGDKDKLWCDHY